MCSWAGLGVMQAQQRRVLRTELWITVSCYITCLVSVFSHFITHSLQILGAVTSEHSDMCSTCVITKARISQSEASTTSFWPIREQQIDNTNSFQQYTCRKTDGERALFTDSYPSTYLSNYTTHSCSPALFCSRKFSTYPRMQDSSTHRCFEKATIHK